MRAGNADVICHYESPRRDCRRMDHYGPRNSVIYVWQNVPMPMMPVHLAATSLKCALWSLGRSDWRCGWAGLRQATWQSAGRPASRVASGISPGASFALWPLPASGYSESVGPVFPRPAERERRRSSEGPRGAVAHAGKQHAYRQRWRCRRPDV